MSSPNVRVRVSFGGTSPRLRAIALDILGAVVPCPPPAFSSSPRSAEGAPERALAALVGGRLPAHSQKYTMRAYAQGAHVWYRVCTEACRGGGDVNHWAVSMWEGA